ncbi:NEDD8 ultimate buster 1 [Linum grandiflorum]
MTKLRVAGTWSGVLDDVDLENWTVPTLRNEVAKRSNVSPASINLICGGRILKDGDGTEKLSQLGVKTNSKVLASRVAVDEGQSLKDELVAEEDRNRRLTRVKEAVSALSKRHSEGALPLNNFNIEIEDQLGNKLHLSEADQQALMMGLMLHTNGKGLIRKGMFKDALEVLTMAEESFSLCNQKTVERIDNIAMLQMDMVWCYFMLKDIACLTVAGVRLEKAREGFERSHGKDASRLKLLQVGNSSGLALYMRLELLEAVVAYHSGQLEKSRRYLMSAETKFKQLQISDEALSVVMAMGFKGNEAKRALRINSQDIGRAVEFLVEEKARKALKREEDILRETEIREQKTYGVTPLNKAVDIDLLKTLVSIGYEKELAAEALRRNENDTEKALDDLTSPETNTNIQNYIESRKAKRQRKHADSKIQQLVSMGFDMSRVVTAVQGGGSVQEITQQLLQQGPDPNPQAATEAASNADADADADANAATASNPQPTDAIPEDEMESSSVEQRDAEMENEIAEELAKGDAVSDYDIDVTIEGEAIHEYLALLDSTGSSSGTASTSA